MPTGGIAPISINAVHIDITSDLNFIFVMCKYFH